METLLHVPKRGEGLEHGPYNAADCGNGLNSYRRMDLAATLDQTQLLDRLVGKMGTCIVCKLLNRDLEEAKAKQDYRAVRICYEQMRAHRVRVKYPAKHGFEHKGGEN